MSDDFSVSVSIPLDSDGFLRRECPTCEEEFKWFSHDEDDPSLELVEQYFCPLCGQPGGVDSWWTPQQLEYVQAAAAPNIEAFIDDSISDALKGFTNVSVTKDGGVDFDAEPPEPLVEPDDLTIVEPPCHPQEPVKVPESYLTKEIHCLICGSGFAV